MTELAAPDATYVRQRWIPRKWIEYAEDAEHYLKEYGAVRDPTVYDTRTKARHRARHLRELLVALRMFDGGELAEHTEKIRQGGYVWSLEYLGGVRHDRPATTT